LFHFSQNVCRSEPLPSSASVNAPPDISFGHTKREALLAQIREQKNNTHVLLNNVNFEGAQHEQLKSRLREQQTTIHDSNLKIHQQQIEIAELRRQLAEKDNQADVADVSNQRFVPSPNNIK
jgi:predicted RNase H-like nuclease (RuvC/YqgF family)